MYSNIYNYDNSSYCWYTPATLHNIAYGAKITKKCTETWNLYLKSMKYYIISFWLLFTISRYPAKICRVEALEKKALIHFEGWNHRFDEWISFDSERIRPSARVVESKDQDKGDKTAQVTIHFVFTTVNMIDRKWIVRLMYYGCVLCDDYTLYLLLVHKCTLFYCTHTYFRILHFLKLEPMIFWL